MTQDPRTAVESTLDDRYAFERELGRGGMAEATLAENLEDPQRHVLLGLALAYRGDHAKAIEKGERGMELLGPKGDGYTGPYLQHQLMRIYLRAGRTDRALDLLEALLRMPYYLSPGWLRVDPTFEPVRGHPRFQRLVAAP